MPSSRDLRAWATARSVCCSVTLSRPRSKVQANETMATIAPIHILSSLASRPHLAWCKHAALEGLAWPPTFEYFTWLNARAHRGPQTGTGHQFTTLPLKLFVVLLGLCSTFPLCFSILTSLLSTSCRLTLILSYIRRFVRVFRPPAMCRTITM